MTQALESQVYKQSIKNRDCTLCVIIFSPVEKLSTQFTFIIILHNLGKILTILKNKLYLILQMVIHLSF